MIKLIIFLLLLSGCGTVSLLDQKREQVLRCVKDLKINDSTTLDAYEVCRQIYDMHKVKE